MFSLPLSTTFQFFLLGLYLHNAYLGRAWPKNISCSNFYVALLQFCESSPPLSTTQLCLWWGPIRCFCPGPQKVLSLPLAKSLYIFCDFTNCLTVIFPCVGSSFLVRTTPALGLGPRLPAQHPPRTLCQESPPPGCFFHVQKNQQSSLANTIRFHYLLTSYIHEIQYTVKFIHFKLTSIPSEGRVLS